jgi:hypothetical protein
MADHSILFKLYGRILRKIVKKAVLRSKSHKRLETIDWSVEANRNGKDHQVRSGKNLTN